MALLRVLSFPSTQQLPPLTPLQFSLPPATTSTSLRSPPSLSLSSIKTRKPSHFLLHVSSATETLATTVEEEEDEGPITSLVVRNVPFTSTADDVRPLFEKYGTVVDIHFWMYDEIKNRGTAFITMSSYEEAVAAMANRNSFELDGRVLTLQWRVPRKKSPPKYHDLFVTNLSFDVTPKDLFYFFDNGNGNVAAEKIIVDKMRRSRGFGYVSFFTREEAEEAMSALQGKIFMGRKIWLEHAKRKP